MKRSADKFTQSAQLDSAARNDALQTRDRRTNDVWNGPGSAAHREQHPSQ
jgi:hypothetical protein